METNLTNSRIERQNILNNELALVEIQEKANIPAIIFEDQLCFTKSMVADFYAVDLRTIERYSSDYLEELTCNGYEILKGKRLRIFLDCVADVPDINVGNISNRTPQLAIFSFKAFLNIGMLLSESDKARALRQLMLDIVIDFINRKLKIGTKYINQRDKNFVFSSLQEENYRRQFTDALKECVVDYKYKYSMFTDLIYVSIFKENAKEYKKILDLKAKDKVRDTFYSEILNLIASYECGFADVLRKEFAQLGRALSIRETKNLFSIFEQSAHWKPLIDDGRIKMSSRDLALREAFHYRLSEYIKPLQEDEFSKFLDSTGDELERLMQENQDVLRRLKESE
ncbi:DNA-binding protein [Bengtsoniella intestinalis]|uniref:DNA-binding protein n=1 Tax=Bengtsoniella intestinalis TaxID=3073143 RepID=UPI00391FBDF2